MQGSQRVSEGVRALGDLQAWLVIVHTRTSWKPKEVLLFDNSISFSELPVKPSCRELSFMKSKLWKWTTCISGNNRVTGNRLLPCHKQNTDKAFGESVSRCWRTGCTRLWFLRNKKPMMSSPTTVPVWGLKALFLDSGTQRKTKWASWRLAEETEI